MIYIKLPERLKNTSPEEKKNFITSDETWAFTEQPHSDWTVKDNRQIPAHDLFNLFTADIIRKKTIFIR